MEDVHTDWNSKRLRCCCDTSPVRDLMITRGSGGYIWNCRTQCNSFGDFGKLGVHIHGNISIPELLLLLLTVFVSWTLISEGCLRTGIRTEIGEKFSQVAFCCTE